ncbi:MAG TPA: hypothetical protein VLJ68_03215 [Chitinophagaceae bacterium]|nr:hypothetical protein [Chitinophagaceae bacterium]
MKETDQQFKRIQEKLQLLLKQYAALEKENIQLKESLGKTKNQNKLHQQNVDGLKQQVNVLKLNAGQMPEADKKEFEKRINAYLKEIDRCIAMLGE